MIAVNAILSSIRITLEFNRAHINNDKNLQIEEALSHGS